MKFIRTSQNSEATFYAIITMNSWSFASRRKFGRWIWSKAFLTYSLIFYLFLLSLCLKARSCWYMLADVSIIQILNLKINKTFFKLHSKILLDSRVRHFFFQYFLSLILINPHPPQNRFMFQMYWSRHIFRVQKMELRRKRLQLCTFPNDLVHIFTPLRGWAETLKRKH